MGSSVKSVVGLALAVFAPQIAGWALTGTFAATTGIAAMALTAGVTLIGASIAGSAFSFEAPDISGVDSYSGQKLQTQKSNVNPVPVLYGENKIAGNIIYQATNDEVNHDDTANGYNRDYWAIIALSGHELNDINKIYAADSQLTSLGSNKWQEEYVHVKWYPTSGSSGMSLADVDFVTNDTGSTQTGSQLNLQTITTYSSNQVLTFSGNVDHELYIEFDCAESGTKSYSASGTSSTLESGASAAGCYYNEYGEGWHGDLSATINLTPVDSTGLTSSRNHVLELSSVTGRGSVSVTQQPTSANNYRAIIYMYDPSGDEDTYGFTATFKEQSATQSFVQIPANISFLAVHQVFDGQHNKNTQLDNITVEAEGKKIRTITNSTTITTTETYSTNPAEIVLDILNNGLAIQNGEIDIASFYQAKTDCDNASWSCNIALIQQANLQSTIQDILSTCRGSIVHSSGKWKMKVDTKSQTNVATLTDDDFINNSLTISMKGNTELANKIYVKYINPDDQWLSAQVYKQANSLLNLDGQLLEKTLDIKGVTNQTQAEILAEITLNAMRYSEDASGNRIEQTPLALSFATTVKNADLEVGDLISINHDVLDRVRNFVILSVETDQSGVIHIATREHCETHYKDSSGNYLI